MLSESVICWFIQQSHSLEIRNWVNDISCVILFIFKKKYIKHLIDLIYLFYDKLHFNFNSKIIFCQGDKTALMLMKKKREKRSFEWMSNILEEKKYCKKYILLIF